MTLYILIYSTYLHFDSPCGLAQNTASFFEPEEGSNAETSVLKLVPQYVAGNQFFYMFKFIFHKFKALLSI